MALTITTPFGAGKNLVYSNAWIMVAMQSDETAQPMFRYCVRFYPTGSAGGGYIFIPASPLGTTMLNVSELIDGQMSFERYTEPGGGGATYFSLSAPQVDSGYIDAITVQAVQEWTLEIQEGYEVAGVFTLDAGTIETHDVYYIKGKKTAYQGGDFGSQTLTPPPTSGVSSGLLTYRDADNSPWIGQKTYANASRAMSVPTFAQHRFSIAYINDDGTLVTGCGATRYRYNLYNGTSLLATQDYTIGAVTEVEAPTSTVAASKLAYIGVGLWNIENTDTTIIPAAKKPSNFTAAWTHYTIQLVSAIAQKSQILVMYREDCFVEPWTLRWSNDLGGVEHYTFDGANMVTDEVERVQTYDQGFNDAGVGIYSVKLGERTVASMVNQSIELKTKMLTVEERKLLATIYRAEALELWSPDGQYWPVTLTEKSTTYRIRTNFELDSFSVKVKLSSDAGSYL